MSGVSHMTFSNFSRISMHSSQKLKRSLFSPYSELCHEVMLGYVVNFHPILQISKSRIAIPMVKSMVHTGPPQIRYFLWFKCSGRPH